MTKNASLQSKAGERTHINPDTEIDFKVLNQRAKRFAKHSTLTESELILSSVLALEQWEACGGRSWQGFHDLLAAVVETLRFS